MFKVSSGECIFMHKRWGCLSHLWEHTVSQSTELSSCYLKVLPCLRGGSLYQEHGTTLAYNTNENLPIWCQGTCIPPGSRTSVMSFASLIVVPLRWTHISLILETLVVTLPFRFCKTRTVIFSFSLKTLKRVKNNQHLCTQGRKNPNPIQLFHIVIIIVIVIIIMVVQWSLLLEYVFVHHTPTVHGVALIQQKRAQKGLEPKWNSLPHIYGVEQISNIIPSLTNAVGMCSPM